MSTIRSSSEHLTLNADGSGKEVKIQRNGTQVLATSSSGIDVTGTVTADVVFDNYHGAAFHSLAVLNSTEAALQRFNLTKEGTGSGNVMQGFAQDPYAGELFTLHVTTSSGVINKFEADGRRSQTATRWNSTPDPDIGHQELDISYDKNGIRWFWTSAGESYNGGDNGQYAMRFQVTDGAGTELVISNKEYFKLFDGSAFSGNCTVSVSLDGSYLISEKTTSTTAFIRVFNLPVLLEGGSGDYSTQYLTEFSFPLLQTTNPLQSIACDGDVIYIFSGYGPGHTPAGNLRCDVYSIKGLFIQTIDDFVVGETEAQGDVAGSGYDYEMEGAGWINNAGVPHLAISIASGVSSTRVNRVWVLGAALSVTAYGRVDQPAFISAGKNDFGVPEGETIRMGHYNQTTGVFTERLQITSDGRGLSQFTAKAWVNFNGQGAVSIRDDHNVSSITDIGVGIFDCFFTNALASNEYAAVYDAQPVASNSGNATYISTYTTTGFRTNHFEVGTVRDSAHNSVIVFGD